MHLTLRSSRLRDYNAAIVSKAALCFSMAIFFTVQIQAQEVVISAGAYMVANGRPSLVINNAALKNSGTFTAAQSTVRFSGNSDTTISFISGSSKTTFYNLITNNSTFGLAMKSNVDVLDSLHILAGHLYTANNLTLKSSATRTAILANVPVNGAGVPLSNVVGNIMVERFVPARRAWRLLSAPMQTAGSPTISQAWQEGLTTASSNANLYPGFGTHITGGTLANGFDQNAANNPSIKIYNNSTDAVVGVSSTNLPVTNYNGYFLFVRGDRSINLAQGTASPATVSTLRMRGKLNTGNTVVAVNPTKYTVVGNPYPAPIDFHALTRSNVADKVYIWDPKLAGAYGVGGYVTLIWNNGLGAYDATSSVSPVSRYIPSGEAFLVVSADNTNPGTITFKEADKNNGGSDGWFGREMIADQRVRINLQQMNTDSSLSLLDGILATYDRGNNNAIDVDDAIKMNNIGENISIMRDGQRMSIERRNFIGKTDTIRLNTYQLKQQQYFLDLQLSNLSSAGIAVLKDKYAAVNNNRLLDMSNSNLVAFSVNADPASYAIDRFSIVFEAPVVVPVTFSSISAVQQQKDIVVSWVTGNEINISGYTLEASADGQSFTKLATIAAHGSNGGSGNYSFTDLNAPAGEHYYRVISTGANGEKQYSKIVRVTINSGGGDLVSIFPNPVKGRSIHLKFSNAAGGKYSAKLTGSSGQVIYTNNLQVNSGNTTAVISLDNEIAAGIYYLELTMPDKAVIIQKIIAE
ncbi:MAG: type sorting protein [Ferruginibacter sp.]|nr:type sorting protein [Ferruginibacter sp.]